MREWPTILRERYPLPPSVVAVVVPERPWWHAVEVKGRVLVLTRKPDNARLTRDAERDAATLLYRAATYDRAHPLPHPGFRVGQIWGNAEGKAITLLTGEAVPGSNDHPWLYYLSSDNGGQAALFRPALLAPSAVPLPPARRLLPVARALGPIGATMTPLEVFISRVRTRALVKAAQEASRLLLRRARWLRTMARRSSADPTETTRLRNDADVLERGVMRDTSRRRELNLRYAMFRGRTYLQVEPNAHTQPHILHDTRDDATFRAWVAAGCKTLDEVEEQAKIAKADRLAEAHQAMASAEHALKVAVLRYKTRRRTYAEAVLAETGQKVSIEDVFIPSVLTPSDAPTTPSMKD